jgi:hypothetical protein
MDEESGVGARRPRNGRHHDKTHGGGDDASDDCRH